MTRSTSPTLRRSLVASIATALASLALLALAACGTSTTPAAQTTPLPDAATVLQKAESATFKDVTFNVTLAETVNGQTINGTGTGTETVTPNKRLQMTLTIPVPGKSYSATVDEVIDFATKTAYTKTSGIPGQTAKWTKTSLEKFMGNSDVDVNAIADLSSFKNPKMIGADTIDGVSVWHLQSTQSASSATGTPATGAAATATAKATAKATASTAAATSTADLYVRQDNSLPERMTIDENSGTTPANVTIDFTKYDSGATIAIPHL
ncbi:MAG TPA: hypothetical protein VF120_11005 [Ktedonobacterales bacterium]